MIKKLLIAFFVTSCFFSLFGEHEAKNPTGVNNSIESNKENIEGLIEKIHEVICDPSELARYLKLRLLEDESDATEALDESLRKLYKFDKEQLSASDEKKLLEAAIKGTQKIRNHFVERWKEVSSKLKVDSNKRMNRLEVAIQKHIQAVTEEYDKMIKKFEEMRSGKLSNQRFTSIECAACTVGYPLLSKGLKEQQLARGSKVSEKECPQKN